VRKVLRSFRALISACEKIDIMFYWAFSGGQDRGAGVVINVAIGYYAMAYSINK
jgi:hypothetical protein